MKTLNELITELEYHVPFSKNDLERAYRLGQINILLELTNELKGYPVNGLVRGIITEEALSDKLIKVTNEH